MTPTAARRRPLACTLTAAPTPRGVSFAPELRRTSIAKETIRRLAQAFRADGPRIRELIDAIERQRPVARRVGRPRRICAEAVRRPPPSSARSVVVELNSSPPTRDSPAGDGWKDVRVVSLSAIRRPHARRPRHARIASRPCARIAFLAPLGPREVGKTARASAARLPDRPHPAGRCDAHIARDQRDSERRRCPGNQAIEGIAKPRKSTRFGNVSTLQGKHE